MNEKIKYLQVRDTENVVVDRVSDLKKIVSPSNSMNDFLTGLLLSCIELVEQHPKLRTLPIGLAHMQNQFWKRESGNVIAEESTPYLNEDAQLQITKAQLEKTQAELRAAQLEAKNERLKREIENLKRSYLPGSE